MSSTLVNYEQQGRVAIIAMDDGKANALSYEMIDALDAALTRAESVADAVVLAGRAGRFSAGFDLREMAASIASYDEISWPSRRRPDAVMV